MNGPRGGATGPAEGPADGDAEAAAEHEGPRRVRARALVFVVLLALAAYGALALYADVDALGSSLRELQVGVIGAALGLSTGNFVLRFGRWHFYLARVGARVPLADSALIYGAGFALTVTPGKVGELIRPVLLERAYGVELARTVPLAVMERVTDLAAVVALASFGSLVLPGGAWIAGVGSALVLALLALLSSERLGHALVRALRRFRALEGGAAKLETALTSFRVLARPGVVLVATVLATVAWGLQCLALMLVANAYAGASITLLESLAAYALPLLAGAAALLPGGLGLTEASMTGLLRQLGGDGMTPAHAAATTIAVRVVTLWWAVALGLVALGAAHLRTRGAQRGVATTK